MHSDIPAESAAELAGTDRFINRELSWLEFNHRVLSLADDATIPLLERLKFCAIYASNLDEFFMVRVAGLKHQVAAGLASRSVDGLTPTGQLVEVRRVVLQQARLLERFHIDRLQPALAAAGLAVRQWSDLGESDREAACDEFDRRIFPVLTPLAVDPGHPFPYISSLSLNLAVQVSDPHKGRRRFARLKVPSTIPRFLQVPSGSFVAVEQVIAANLQQLFPGMRIVGAWAFRVTRNADFTLNDADADDLVEAVELELRRRRFGRAIRLEVDHSMPAETLQLLMRELDLDAEDVYDYRGLLDCTGYWQLVGVDRPDLLDPPFTGVIPAPLRDLEDRRQLFARLREADVLLHHPYDSFNDSVGEFVHQASLDPQVLAIKQTLYRTSGDSPIVQSLIRAAELGKQVAVLVEVKARFDEQANIQWARRLEEAGVHVAYGLIGLKIHTKTTLVVRDEPDGIRRYCHIGTGNYNSKTASTYEDLGLLTADPEIGDDLTQMFNFLTGYGHGAEYGNLLIAPLTLRSTLRDLIRQEMEAGDGRIVLKLNSLVDAELIDLLYEASGRGVSIDLIVRGICGLVPGVPGLSENIRVRSILGRYLEHSRIYCFANGDGPSRPSYHIGSADLMPRNLDRRVEALVHITDPRLIDRLAQILDINLADDWLAWELGPDRVYRRLSGRTVNAHDTFQALAIERSALERSATTAVPTDSISPQGIYR